MGGRSGDGLAPPRGLVRPSTGQGLGHRLGHLWTASLDRREVHLDPSGPPRGTGGAVREDQDTGAPSARPASLDRQQRPGDWAGTTSRDQAGGDGAGVGGRNKESAEGGQGAAGFSRSWFLGGNLAR